MLTSTILMELEQFVEEHIKVITYRFEALDELENYNIKEAEPFEIEIEDYIKTKKKPTLNEVLFNFIDQKNVKDSIIYKKAGIDRKHFSKIRSNPNYHPKKNTIIALALALELNSHETDKLLHSAGYSLSDSDTNDLVIQFCLERKIYSIDLVNQALEHYRLKPLLG